MGEPRTSKCVKFPFFRDGAGGICGSCPWRRHQECLHGESASSCASNFVLGLNLADDWHNENCEFDDLKSS
jgi:hypothetical protein